MRGCFVLVFQRIIGLMSLFTGKLTYIVSFYFVGLFFLDICTMQCFIHPEVIDKYPKYLTYRGLVNELGKSFDPCNGEACVKDALYANRCNDEGVCESRSRNLNYFTDYVDAMFTKYLTIKIGMLSHVCFTFLSVLMLYRGGLLIAAGNKGMALMFSSFVFCWPNILFLNGVLYRSGKILSVFYIAVLFYQFVNIMKIRPTRIRVLPALILSCLFVLADEMAVAATGLFVLILVINNKYKTAAIFSIVLLWYFLFRFLVEPFLAFKLNHIRLTLHGGYTDFRTFFQIDFDVLTSVWTAFLNQFLFMLGKSSYLGNNMFRLAGLACVGGIVVLCWQRFGAWPTMSKPLPTALVHPVSTIFTIFLYWTGICYLMALRHPPIVSISAYGGSYYFLPTMALFYVVFVFIVLSHWRPDNRSQLLAICALFLFATGNFVNARLDRQSLNNQVMGSDWTETSSRIIELIQKKEVTDDQVLYLKHKKFIDCYLY